MDEIKSLEKWQPLIPYAVGATVVGLGLVGGYILLTKFTQWDPRTIFGETIPSWLEDLLGEETVEAAKTLSGTDKKEVDKTMTAAIQKTSDECDEMIAANAMQETDLAFQGLLTNPLDLLWWTQKKLQYTLQLKDIAKRCAEEAQRKADEEAARLEPVYEEPATAPDYHGVSPYLYPEPPPIQPEPPPPLVWEPPPPPPPPDYPEPTPPPIVEPPPEEPTIICPPGFTYNKDTKRCDPISGYQWGGE